MRITLELLQKYSQKPLEEAEYLDLSGAKISMIEQLDHCSSLQTLHLSNNRITVLQNISCCQQLWAIDLTGNRVKSLHGLSQFPVLGSLKLACNELEWSELPRLYHMTLLSLTLCGNPHLDSDPHYREHVVDSLPNLWALDGRLITAEERKQVSQFFLKSESSSHPVWRKASDRVFVPTSMKNLLVTGVFGEKTSHMMGHFPATYTPNREMDRRRLHYLAHTLEEEMKLETKYKKQLARLRVPELSLLVKRRDRETEQSNMLLLLLLAHLEYGLPRGVVKATLETAKLTKLGGVECESVFDLPNHMMLDVASLLLSAAAIDRQDKDEGGVYKKLFQSLVCVLDSQQRKAATLTAAQPLCGRRKLFPKEREDEAHLQCLLASEVVHLLCLVPLFFQELETHPGLLQLVCVATSNPHVGDVIGSLTWKVQSRGGDVWDVYHDVADFLLQSTSDIVQGRRKGVSLQRQRHNSGVRRTTSQLLPSTQPRHPSLQARVLSASHVPHHHPSHPPPLHSSHPRSVQKPQLISHHKELELGDLVVLSSENIARVVALPEKAVVVLQMTSSNSSLSVAPDSYFYTETDGLTWDHCRQYWTRHDQLATDLSEIQLHPLPVDPGSVSRAMTPDPDRPHSGFMSDYDLQTIPSESELDFGNESEATVNQPPMRVDISDSRPPSRTLNTDEAKTEHQKQVLTRLSHDLDTEYDPTPSPSFSPSPPLTCRPPLSRDFTIPSPQIHHLDKWDRSKSVPPVASHKHHTCHDLSPLPPSSLSHTAGSPPLPLLHHSTIAFQPSSQASEQQTRPGIIHRAWSPVRTHALPKQTILSTTRLMNRRATSMASSAVRTKKRASSAPGGQQRWSTTTIIMQPKTTKGYQCPPRHMSAYTTTSKNAMSKYHFSPEHTSCKAPPTRQLGEMRHLFVGGMSIT